MLVEIIKCQEQRTPLRPAFRGSNLKIKNFHKVDEFLWRGSKPSKQQLKQLSKNEFKNIIDFRVCDGSQGYVLDEGTTVKRLGMKYLSLPFFASTNPPPQYIKTFFETLDIARRNKEKTFIHCTKGMDRTGFFSAIYKIKYGIDNLANCIKEMINFGHDYKKNPNLIPYLIEFEKTLRLKVKN